MHHDIPDVLNILRCTHDVPCCTHGISQYTEHPLMYSWYPHMHHSIPSHASRYPPDSYQAFTLFFDCTIMYQTIPSLTIPPGDPRGFAHSSCPRGRVFAPLSCPGVCSGVLSQSKSSIILNFHLSLKQLSSSSFHMFIYARSEQCDLVPIYIVTNTQHIRIYPCKLTFILVKISSDPGQRKSNSIHVSYY